MQALDHGPDYLPQSLFSGPSLRVLAGMKVHANTVSHGRLVALEETYPRTRVLLGHDRFNEHSRLFVQQPGVTAAALANIGCGFSDFLASGGEVVAADMARFEWLWLESFHAADAAPLLLADLAGIAPEALMALVVARHPAARMEHFGHELIAAIGGNIGVPEGARTILISRPAHEVLISPANPAMASAFALAQVPQTLGNLFAVLDEPGRKERFSPDDIMAAIIDLLNVGALVRARSDEAEFGECTP